MGSSFTLVGQRLGVFRRLPSSEFMYLVLLLELGSLGDIGGTNVHI